MKKFKLFGSRLECVYAGPPMEPENLVPMPTDPNMGMPMAGIYAAPMPADNDGAEDMTTPSPATPVEKYPNNFKAPDPELMDAVEPYVCPCCNAEYPNFRKFCDKCGAFIPRKESSEA